MRRVSADGRAKIRQREGCVLKTYLDTVGVPTCCVGHTGRMSPPAPRLGETFTTAQADDFLAADLAPVEAAIDDAVTVPLSQHELDALASLGFNIGTGGLRRSSVVRRLNAGDVDGAADAFLLWSKPAVLAGRRKAERLQFLTPDPAVAAARATRLAVQASRAKAQAGTGQAAGGALIAAGAALAPAAAVAHHPSTALAAGGLLALAGLVSEIVAALGHRRAGALAAAAGRQSNVAHGLAPALQTS